MSPSVKLDNVVVRKGLMGPAQHGDTCYVPPPKSHYILNFQNLSMKEISK